MKNKLLLFGYVFAASFGAFVVGLNLGGISGALEFITAEFGLSAMAMGLVTSAIMIGCLIGALLGGRYSDKYGRKNMMIISAVALILSAVGCALASNVAWLIAARFLGGCGMGVLSAVIPIYISEISPAKWRGTFVSFYQLFIVIGILAAYCADFGMISWVNNWRWMLGLPLLFAAGNLLMLLFLPESPRWLIRQGEYEVARRAIARMGISAEDAAVMLETPQPSQKGGPKLSELFRGSTAYIVLLGSLLAVFQQITGINVIINYAPEILRHWWRYGAHAGHLCRNSELFVHDCRRMVGGSSGTQETAFVGMCRTGRIAGVSDLCLCSAATRQYRYSDCPACLHRFLCSVAFPAYVCRYSRNISIGDPGYGHGAFDGDQLGLRIPGRAVLPRYAGEFRCSNRFCRIRNPLSCSMAVYLHLDS